MEGAVGDRARADSSRENSKGHVCGDCPGEEQSEEKGFGPLGRRTVSGRVLREPVEENPRLLVFCGFLRAKLE